MFHCWQTWLNLFAQCSNIYIVIMNFATKNSLQWDNFCISHTLTLFSNFIFRGKTKKTWTWKQFLGFFLNFQFFWIDWIVVFVLVIGKNRKDRKKISKPFFNEELSDFRTKRITYNLLSQFTTFSLYLYIFLWKGPQRNEIYFLGKFSFALIKLSQFLTIF